ncbi:hypothetical protein [Chlamydia avium]|uniref:Serine rich exported domain protein n=1 Tax=Chlamydia avium 10DC88 TaxID=1229831 RepID=W8JEK6_9CHLA|nr:hypothetical protein [Chlamydia avium]AHK63006.1 Putative serine rich exported domain protein [Chlamydia avium 10DC88]
MTSSPVHKHAETAQSANSSVTALTKGKKLLAWITLFILTLFPLVFLGALLITPFIPQAVFIGLGSLAVFLLSISTLSIMASYLSPSTPSPTLNPVTRPRDLDLSKLDTRHNRLLHEIIRQDEQKYQQEKKNVRSSRFTRKASKSRSQSSESSSSELSPPLSKKPMSVPTSSSDSDTSPKASDKRIMPIQNRPWLSFFQSNKN